MTSVGALVRAKVLDAHQDKIGTRFYLDYAPEDVQTPYVTYNDSVSYGPNIKGDSRTMYFDKGMTFNIWQNAQAEDPDLPWEVVNTLDGLLVESEEPGEAFAIRVESCLRVEEPQGTNLTHHEISVQVAIRRGVG